MKYSLIVAIDANNGFAKNNKIPWYFKEDFKHFKSITSNHVCVMGRHTYEEINEKLGDKAKDSVLPNRTCFVLSNTLKSLPNAYVISSLEDITNFIVPNNTTIFLIGGKKLFDLGIKIVDNIFITHINEDYSCDVFFDFDYVKNNYKLINTRNSDQVDRLTFMHFSRNDDDNEQQTTGTNS